VNRTAVGPAWEEVAEDVTLLSIVQVLGPAEWVELWAAADEPLAGQPGVVLVPGDTMLKSQLEEVFPSGKLFGRAAEQAVVSCM
jgi:hypothetical protein